MRRIELLLDSFRDDSIIQKQRNWLLRTVSHVCILFIHFQKEDPLKRIQAEISEVEKRERELREKKMLLSNLNGSFLAGGALSPTSSASSCVSDNHSSLSSTPDKDPGSDCVSAFSDDSGISSSSSPVNGQSTNTSTPTPTIPRYVRSSTVQNAISVSSKFNQKPQTHTANTRFQISPARKGIMQRFIATRAANAAAAAAHNNTSVAGNEALSKRNNSILVSIWNGHAWSGRLL